MGFRTRQCWLYFFPILRCEMHWIGNNCWLLFEKTEPIRDCVYMWSSSEINGSIKQYIINFLSISFERNKIIQIFFLTFFCRVIDQQEASDQEFSQGLDIMLRSNDEWKDKVIKSTGSARCDCNWESILISQQKIAKVSSISWRCGKEASSTERERAWILGRCSQVVVRRWYKLNPKWLVCELVETGRRRRRRGREGPGPTQQRCCLANGIRARMPRVLSSAFGGNWLTLNPLSIPNTTLVTYRCKAMKTRDGAATVKLAFSVLRWTEGVYGVICPLSLPPSVRSQQPPHYTWGFPVSQQRSTCPFT